MGPEFTTASVVSIYKLSGTDWVVDDSISLNLDTKTSVIEGDRTHIQMMISIAATSVSGMRKIKVVTGSTETYIDNKFQIQLPMVVSMDATNLYINPNGNPLGTDPTTIKLRVFMGQFASPDITTGFTIDSGTGFIQIPLASHPEFKTAKEFNIDILRSSDNGFLGKARYMKPGVGPDKVMPGSINIPLDVWAPLLTVGSQVTVNKAMERVVGLVMLLLLHLIIQLQN